jgi:hypothetical protein
MAVGLPKTKNNSTKGLFWFLTCKNLIESLGKNIQNESTSQSFRHSHKIFFGKNDIGFWPTSRPKNWSLGSPAKAKLMTFQPLVGLCLPFRDF